MVTPSFNRDKFIEKTVQSVLTQVHANIEYIVVDGKSTDRTGEILEKYRRAKGLHYISEPDDGMYHAINKGFKMATGEVLAYLNADDYYFPWTVGTIVRAFSSDPQTDILYGDTMVFDMDTNHYYFNFTLDFSPTWLRCGANLAQPAVFIRRKVYDELGDLAKDVVYLGDCEYWLRALKAGFNFRRIPEFLAIECNHEQTLRNRYELQIEEEKLFLLKKYGCKFGSSSLMRKLYKRSKYVEKEMITMRFMRNALFHRKKGFWNNFISSYNVKCHFGYYIMNKIFRSNNPIWSVSSKKDNSPLMWKDEQSG